ncbi:GAF domain-containing protein [Roseateles amylovorans]|uniref:GAF domain-containing protein n=1 Tax=Roseateles amylovorans TaxID=2978473 RepID=A0ABY6B910_9BURK|nr:GAF domain-containing protein [Roseateles amylovorans]UXH80060.1 GAF domain-containing protein [Roseateles amylovorans]
MICAPHPRDELVRLRVLESSGLLATDRDPFLDSLVVAVARSFELPMAAVSLIERDQQFFKASVGLPTRTTPRDCSFCAHVLWWPAPFVVPDATLDDRFANNPLVTGEPHIRFYAGVPISLQGVCLGTLCVMGHSPKSGLDDAEMRLLQGAAMAVEERLNQMTSPQPRERAERLDRAARRTV